MKNRKFKGMFVLLLVFTVLSNSACMVYAGDEPYLGEIQLFAFNYAPYGWAQCNGQILTISQNSALFALLGTQYGGDGKTTFALPDLNGGASMDSAAQPWGNSAPGVSRGGYYCIALNGYFPSSQ